MKKVLTTYFALVVVTLAIANPQQPKAVYNISCIDLKEYKLMGPWEFYWMQLLTPDEINSKRLTLHPRIINVPSNWAETPGLYRYGYGTYHAKVILPQKEKLYALKLKDIFSAYNVWINDSLYFENGRVGTSRAEELPKRGTQIITFFATKDTVDIVIQVSSYDHRNGGILKPPVIGYAHYITNSFLVKSISVFFIFGAFIIFAIYLLWLYNYTKKNFDAFLLGVSILLAGIYTLFNDDFLITSIFPGMTWDVVHKINFFANYAKIFFLFAFFKMVLKKYMTKFWNIVITVINISLLILSLLVLVTPTRVFSSTLMLFIVALGIGSVYVVVGYFQLIIHENDKTFIIPFLGILLLALLALNDVLHEFHVIHSAYLSDFGLFVFVATQAILISEKQIHTLHKAEKLTSYFKKLDTIKKHISAVPFNSTIPLLKILKKHFQADVVMYFTVEDSHYYLKAVVDNKREREYERKIELDNSQDEKNRVFSDFLELAAHNEQAFIIHDKNKLYGLIKRKFNLTFKSILISTVGTKGKIIGLVYLEKDHDYFTPSDQKLLTLISFQIATIINNIKIFRQLENINKNLQKIVEQRTQKIAERNEELEIRNIELDEKVEELRITAEIINAMNDEIKSQQEILEEKNRLLLKQTKSLEKQKAIIEELNKQIRESIQYALRIQNALLNSQHNQPPYEHFIISRAKETVSGNFWWYTQINDYEIMAFGQSEISGIQGAFLSLVAYSIMNEISYEFLINYNFNQVDIAEIEKLFNKKISLHLRDQKIHFSTILYHQKNKQLKSSYKDNFIYLINKEVKNLAPHSTSPAQLIPIKSTNYFIAFTNNFVKELINKNKIFKLEEINQIIDQVKHLETLDNIKTFFENYLVGSHDLDILIVGIKFE